MHRLTVAVIALVASVVEASPAFAQTFNSGSTGADGAFNPPVGTTTLSPPQSGTFNFTTVNVPTGATVRFTRNAANTPVTILASGNVTIAGVVDIRGTDGGASKINGTIVGGNGGAGGPGGYDGGSGAAAVMSPTGGAGLGPGGGVGSTGAGGGGGGAGALSVGAAGKGTGGSGWAAYGTAALLPLVGGSGGGGGGAVGANTGAGGGGGGGALVIASSGTLTLTGTILAHGTPGGGITGAGVAAGGGGSGGSVRLVATTIAGSGVVNVAGGNGGALTTLVEGGGGAPGRVRVEAFTNTLVVGAGTGAVGVVSSGAPTSVTLPTTPALRIAAIGGVTAPDSPSGSFSIADVVLPPTVTNPVTVSLAGTNIPVGTTVTVTVKALHGEAASVVSTPLAGTLASSTASASVTIPVSEPSVVAAWTSFVFSAAAGQGPLYVNGEEVEHVRVTADPAGESSAVYVTASGRDIPSTLLR